MVKVEDVDGASVLGSDIEAGSRADLNREREVAGESAWLIDDVDLYRGFPLGPVKG